MPHEAAPKTSPPALPAYRYVQRRPARAPHHLIHRPCAYFPARSKDAESQAGSTHPRPPGLLRLPQPYTRGNKAPPYPPCEESGHRRRESRGHGAPSPQESRPHVGKPMLPSQASVHRRIPPEESLRPHRCRTEPGECRNSRRRQKPPLLAWRRGGCQYLRMRENPRASPSGQGLQARGWAGPRGRSYDRSAWRSPPVLSFCT